MESHNRRLLLLNEDVPIPTSISPLPYLQNTEPMTPAIIITTIIIHVWIFSAITSSSHLHFPSSSSSPPSSSLASSSYTSANSPPPPPSATVATVPSATADAKPLPAVPYRGDSNPQQVECAICLDEFLEGETVKTIPHCKHVFHPECIDTWFVEHVTCPVCSCTKVCEVNNNTERGSGVVENEGGGEEGREELRLDFERGVE